MAVMYKVREGIVLVHICDAFILTGTRAVWHVFPHLRQIPESTALCVHLLQKGMRQEQIAEHIAKLYEVPFVEVKEKLTLLWEDLCQAGYLVKIEEGRSI